MLVPFTEMMMQPRELVLLTLLLAGLFPVLMAYRRDNCPRFTAAYLLLVVNGITTVAEGLMWPAVFNAVEHTATLAASLVFALTAYRSHQAIRARPGDAA